MKPKSFMLIAGEASGDWLAAELVTALRARFPDAVFFGAGGPHLAAAGVELAFDLTQHSVVGLTDVLVNLLKFRRLFHDLLARAIARQPDVIIGVDYGGFNLRFGAAIRKYQRDNPFSPWKPRLVQFVSPQVWASRPGRARQLERDYDLLLSIFPFEPAWYAVHAPKLRVEFVGHPLLSRFASVPLRPRTSVPPLPLLLLLPGSRRGELQRHLPVMLPAVAQLRTAIPGLRVRMVLPNEAMRSLARSLGGNAVELQTGDLPRALAEADVALASTGTVTMECAFFGVPTVTLYRTSWLTYEIARRIVTVKSLTMPNLLADTEVFPEFIQTAATPENLASAVRDLLESSERRQRLHSQLERIIASLGQPGAPDRAAAAVALTLTAPSPKDGN